MYDKGYRKAVLDAFSYHRSAHLWEKRGDHEYAKKHMGIWAAKVMTISTMSDKTFGEILNDYHRFREEDGWE